MPNDNLIERRNRAMMALLLLTSPRIAALQTARVDSVKFDRDQDHWFF